MIVYKFIINIYLFKLFIYLDIIFGYYKIGEQFI